MRVLVTGASGVFGRVICRGLVREGALVTALARRKVEIDGVDSVQADIRDAEAVERAMRGCDRVVHLAYVLAPMRSTTGVEEVNLGGMRNVLRAMESTGANHLVYSSSTLAYGPWPDNPRLVPETQPLRPHPEVKYAQHKAICERMIEMSGVPAVITRTCVVSGRELDNYEFRFLAHPVLVAPTGDMRPWQFIHTDDVGRFHVQATLGDRTGVVNVGPTDPGLVIEEISEVLQKPLIRLPFRVLKGIATAAWRFDALELSPADLDGFRYMPALDTTRLVRDWNFEPVYTSREALADARESVHAAVYIGKKQFPTPWRLPVAPHDFRSNTAQPGVELVDPAPEDMRGEFDNLIDPRYPTLTTANVGEAFAGTLTPASLLLGRDALRASSALQVDLLGMRDPELQYAQRNLGIASVAHRLYCNVSVVHAMAEAMPGTSARDVDVHFLGIDPDAASDPDSPPSTARIARTVRQLGSIPFILARMRSVTGRVESVQERLRNAPGVGADLSGMSLNALLSQADALRVLVIDAWALSTTTNMAASASQALLQRVAPGIDPAQIRNGADELASAALLAGVERLTKRARVTPAVTDLLRSGTPEEFLKRIDDLDPGYARALRRLCLTAGHRGPRETELASAMYGDEPESLVSLIAKGLDAPVRPSPPTLELSAAGRRAAALIATAVRRREWTKDITMHATHALRLTLREIGRRAVGADALEQIGDVFYLTFDELAAPDRHGSVVERRRAEHARLAALSVPTLFTLRWQPTVAPAAATTGNLTLKGIGVSAGKGAGPARVLDLDNSDIEPGEVLVANVTDVGCTPLFSLAAAVVTDIGGLQSHAAIVARELGIPCVVNTRTASRDVRQGEWVEVDGSSGEVTVARNGDGVAGSAADRST